MGLVYLGIVFFAGSLADGAGSLALAMGAFALCVAHANRRIDEWLK
jgi:hypothetical protein